MTSIDVEMLVIKHCLEVSYFLVFHTLILHLQRDMIKRNLNGKKTQNANIMPFKIKHFDDFCQTLGGTKDAKAIAFQSSPVVDVYDRQSTCGRSEYPRIYFEECRLNTHTSYLSILVHHCIV